MIAEAERLGIHARELRPGEDARALAHESADAGAPALGAAGGDGSLAEVVEAALERDLPFVCVPFGTRNHFARDLGVEPDDPLAALSAFRGQQKLVDVGVVNGRVFLNNVSLGVYAAFVRDPERMTRNRLMAFVRMASAAVGRNRTPLALSFEAGGHQEEHQAFVVLVSNNDYRMSAIADPSARTRLDAGVLHAYVIGAVDRRRMLAMLGRAVAGRVEEAEGWVEWSAEGFRIDARRSDLQAAVDGEPAVLETPLEFEIRPRALRALVPPG